MEDSRPTARGLCRGCPIVVLRPGDLPAAFATPCRLLVDQPHGQ
jgi:hypothetical protein